MFSYFGIATPACPVTVTKPHASVTGHELGVGRVGTSQATLTDNVSKSHIRQANMISKLSESPATSKGPERLRRRTGIRSPARA